MPSSWPRRFKRGASFLAVGYAAAAGAIATAGLQDHVEAADAVVVLRGPVMPDGVPGPRLHANLQAGLSAWRAHAARGMVLVGKPGNVGWDESAVMADVVSHAGVAPRDVVQAPRGRDLAEAASEVAALARERGWRSVLLAGNVVELPRARLAMSRAGLRVVGTVHGRFAEPRDLFALLGEVWLMPAWALGLGQPAAVPAGDSSA